MEFAITFAYAAVYFVGYYGAHVLNLVTRRVLLVNLRSAGLALVALVAAAVAVFIEFKAPLNANAFAKAHFQGRFAIAPALVIGIIVGMRMWLEIRKQCKPREYRK